MALLKSGCMRHKVVTPLTDYGTRQKNPYDSSLLGEDHHLHSYTSNGPFPLYLPDAYGYVDLGRSRHTRRQYLHNHGSFLSLAVGCINICYLLFRYSLRM